MTAEAYRRALADRRLAEPPGLAALIEAPRFEHAEPWLVRGAVEGPDDAFAIVEETAPENLLPFAMVDDLSVACVVCAPIEYPDDAAAGLVVRWHLTDVDPKYQASLLDIGIVDYVSSLEEEVASRSEGLHRILDEIGPAYEESYIEREKRPRDFVVRPVRIACQNVIVGLAAIAQDSNFDGLSVPAWQTCEVPHVATHEANRALAALMLCDAFQNGGTMEIRFDRRATVTLPDRSVTYDGHPEGQVPASLRRAVSPKTAAAERSRFFFVGSGSCSAASVSAVTTCPARLSAVGHWPTRRLARSLTLGVVARAHARAAGHQGAVRGCRRHRAGAPGITQ